jgi:hypothetical protein
MTMPKIDTTSFGPAHQAAAYAKNRGARPSTGATEPPQPSLPVPAGDHAEISESARELVDLRTAVDTGRAALASEPETRADRVAEAKERLAAGHYQSLEVRQKTAARLQGVIEGLDRL